MDVKQNYSVTLNVFRKGTYKVKSIRLENNELEAIKYKAGKPSETIIHRALSEEEASEFGNYLSSFPLDSLNGEYADRTVKGEHHLKYKISIGEKQKEIYVYFAEQEDLKLLYKKLMLLIPAKERFWYYGY